MREALESFLSELSSSRRCSPHTLAAYRQDLTRVLDMVAGEGQKVSAAQWDQPLLERAMHELFRTGHAASSTARALAAWRSFGRFAVRRGLFARKTPIETFMAAAPEIDVLLVGQEP